MYALVVEVFQGCCRSCRGLNVPSKVCWSMIKKLLLSTSSPNVIPSAGPLLPAELPAEVPGMAAVTLDVIFWAMVLALGWRGRVVFVAGSKTSIRIEITPNVCVDSWYAIRLKKIRQYSSGLNTEGRRSAASWLVSSAPDQTVRVRALQLAGRGRRD